MAVLGQARRLVRLEEERKRKKFEWDNRPYTQIIYYKEDKNLPKEKRRVLKKINHKGLVK